MEKIKPVLDWIKGHMLISMMSLLIIAFLACGWYFSGSFNSDLKSDVDARKQEFQKLDRAAKTSVSLPMIDGNFSSNGTLNQQLIDSLKALSGVMSEDVDEAKLAALRHNGDPSPDDSRDYKARVANEGPTYPGTSAGRGASSMKDWRDHEAARRTTGSKRVLVSERLFPNPPREQRENLSNEIHKALLASYAAMLEDAGAGAPPTLGDVEADLTRVRSNYIQRDLHKGTEADLDDQERELLKEKLGSARLQFYNEAAEQISFYGSANAFVLPEDPFQTKAEHSLGELYGWHWDWWIAEDIVAAIMNANSAPDGRRIPVTSAPVKRLVSLTTLDPPLTGKGSGSGSGSSSRQARSSRSQRQGGAVGKSDAGPLGEPQVSMDVDTKTDYSISFTGRQSNALYDVRNVELDVIVETRQLPVLVDALAQENFMTITDLTLSPTSAFEAANFGYMFGDQPVSRVKLTLETIWFRKWTAAWMPQEIRDVLGVKTSTAGSAG